MAEPVRMQQRSRVRSSARHMVLVLKPRFKIATWFGLEGVATSFLVATWPIGGSVATPF